MRSRFAIAVLTVAAFGWAPSDARGDWRPDGSLGAHVLVGPASSNDGVSRIGGGLIVDLLHPFRVTLGPRSEFAFKLGLGVGISGLSSENADANQMFTPAGLSLLVGYKSGGFGIAVNARLGLWAGATNMGLSAGGYVAAGARVEWWLDDTVGLTAGVEAWWLLGSADAFALAPTLALTWRLED